MKIFGIGMPKTGNHSLTEAMRILGYKCCHFPDTDRNIEENDFLCDNPIIYRYKELDKKYPDSKFVFMERDDKSWGTSILNHFKRKRVKDLKPSRKDMRLKIFGSLEPTLDKLLETKHKHERNVRDYFKGRRDDVLFINIIEGEGWEKLCTFLNKPIPDTPFPKENVTKNLYKS